MDPISMDIDSKSKKTLDFRLQWMEDQLSFIRRLKDQRNIISELKMLDRQVESIINELEKEILERTEV